VFNDEEFKRANRANEIKFANNKFYRQFHIIAN
jgi:hypothetical protein